MINHGFGMSVLHELKDLLPISSQCQLHNALAKVGQAAKGVET